MVVVGKITYMLENKRQSLCGGEDKKNNETMGK